MPQEKPGNVPRAGFPRSPCIDVCTLDGDDVCVGCRRTLGEIVAWSTMTADEQWAVLRALPARSK